MKSGFVSCEKLVGVLQIHQQHSKSPREESNSFKVHVYLSCFPWKFAVLYKGQCTNWGTFCLLETGYFFLHYKTVEKTQTSDYHISSFHNFSNSFFKFLLNIQLLAWEWKKSENTKYTANKETMTILADNIS